MSRAIFEKPLSELTWSDFADIVDKGLEEDQTLEFKETLQVKDGNADPWQSGRDKITDYARDSLAEEVVAFANAYGGVVIVGIEETDDDPRRAKAFKTPLVRNCVECVERLGQALRSRFDPPISGFQIRAFPKPNGDGEGLIIIRVASSTVAPHGVGRPPVAHIRRGSIKEPLTMRDLHNLFWESRTRRERVQQIQNERRQFVLNFINEMRSGRLTPLNNSRATLASQPYLLFRCTVIPEQPLGLKGIAAELIKTPLERPTVPINGKSSIFAFGTGPLLYGWRPKAHAAQAEDFSDRMFSQWTIGDDGLVDVVGFSHPRNAENKHYPGWFCLTVAQVLLMAEKIRLKAGRPDVPFVVDAQFQHEGTAMAMVDQELAFYFSLSKPDENVNIGPFVVATRAEIPDVYNEIEREVWFGLGVPRVIQAKPDFEACFSSYLGVQA